jgi:hypothetical protein
MASLEEIASLLRKLNDKINVMIGKQQAMDTRLVVMEQKRRQHNTSPPKQDVEKKTAFEDVPASDSKDSSGPLLRELGEDHSSSDTGLSFTPAGNDTINLQDFPTDKENSHFLVVPTFVASYEYTTLPRPTLVDELMDNQLTFDESTYFEPREEREHDDVMHKNGGTLDEPSFFMLTQEDLYDVMQKTFAAVDFTFRAYFRPTPEYFQLFYDDDYGHF